MEIDSTPAGTDVDNDLEAVIMDAIMSLNAVRPSAAVVNVHVQNGQVTLTGYVQSPMAAVEVERTAEDVPGVTDVINDIVDDGSLSRLVAEVLATDPATRDIPPGSEVTPTFGYITLIGWFKPEQVEAITAVTAAIPGVRGVKVKNLS